MAALVVCVTAALAACGATRPLGRGHEELNAGSHVLDLARKRSSERGQLPEIQITLPSGWFNYDGWAISKGREATTVFLTFWDVDRVYSTPCKWKYKPLVDPGRRVSDLASALARQPLRAPTKPTEVVVGGYRGEYLEWSVPTDIDFEDCDEGVFESWTGRAWASDRYQQAPGQVDRIWILDVRGTRLVVDASYLPEATDHDRAELETVVKSIRFFY